MTWLKTIADIMMPGIGTKIVRLELAVLAAACFLAWVRPQCGSRMFGEIERRFRWLAERRRLAALSVGAFVLVLRTALLPVAPVAVPGWGDEFSYLLAADTFAHGRLANPTHPMWIHFESFHIDQQPTYASMYPPVQGMVLAAGQAISGRPWIGVWLAAAAMCATITWMLQGWIAPEWALLGGLLAALRIATFSYWINTLFGGAAGALGGALVIGSLPRIAVPNPRAFHALWMVVGIGIILNSRPFEGAIVSAGACVALVWLLMRARPPMYLVLRRIALPIGIAGAILIAAMAYYSWRVFGSPFTPPYSVNRATYAVSPVFVFQSVGPEPSYHHDLMRKFYLGWELGVYRDVRTPGGFVKSLGEKWKSVESFFLGPALLIPLLAFPGAVLSRRIRVSVLIAAPVACALLTEVWVSPHYLSPITCVVYAVVVEAIRRLRAWQPGGRRSGVLLSRAVPLTCLLTVLIVAAGRAVGFNPVTVTGLEFVTPYWGLRDRATMLARLERLPGKHLVVVRYAPDHSVHAEWVYNEADIDAAKVVWAREMDSASDRRLISYFSDRRVWLLEPDVTPPRISDYSAVGLTTAP
jgi:hypothetical protein